MPLIKDQETINDVPWNTPLGPSFGLQFLRVDGVAKKFRVLESRFQIRISIFDELELIISVSKGLTLSTTSLLFSLVILLNTYFITSRENPGRT